MEIHSNWENKLICRKTLTGRPAETNSRTTDFEYKEYKWSLRLVKCGCSVTVHGGTLPSMTKVCTFSPFAVASGGFIPLGKADLQI